MRSLSTTAFMSKLPTRVIAAIGFGNFTVLMLFLSTIAPATTRSFVSNKCEAIPRDSQLVQRAGDGEYEIKVFLLPPELDRRRGSGNQGMFWPISLGKHLVNFNDSDYVPLREYLPGRDYQIILTPKRNPIVANAFVIEAAYLTAVPVGTPQNQEIRYSKGTFSPTICTSPNVGAIEIKYNFPRQITFIWTAPTLSERVQTGVLESNAWDLEKCLELRSTVVPWHWHRMYFRNAGGLKHVLCPAQDQRQIDHWPNYIDVAEGPKETETKSDGVRVRSVHSDGRLTGFEARDRYTDSGFYGADESGSCSVQELPKPVRRCCACNTAVYRLIIQSDWQQQQHWRDWPAAEITADGKTVSPHWSEILGASHSPLYDIFHAGGFASPAVDALCTTSDVSKLESEFRNQAGENIFTVIRTRGIDSTAPPKQRIRSALFAVNSTHHLISFLTRLVPSTDWCTGLSRVDVCLPNCSWPLRMQFRLEPWDAGVLSGNTYIPVEPSERLREPKPMCPITPDLRPNTPFTVQTDYIPLPSVAGSDSASNFVELNTNEQNVPTSGKNPFRLAGIGSAYSEPRRRLHSPGATRLKRTFAPLGTVELELLRINEHETCTEEPAQEDQAFGHLTAEHQVRSRSDPASRCHLGSWSQWGPCIAVDPTTCQTVQQKSYWSSKSPKMQRTRSILPPATMKDCAGISLKEEKTCHPVSIKERCPSAAPKTSTSNLHVLSAEACQTLPWGPWSECWNATCSRPGMVYRWRRFPDQQTQQACRHYPDVSQMDTCWPPTHIPCSLNQLKQACADEPPLASKLCPVAQNATTRYYFNSAEQRCQPFEYVPTCHLRAIAQQQTGHTRNVFYDRSSCEKFCLTNGAQVMAAGRYLAKRDLSQMGRCSAAVDVGHSCPPRKSSSKWYFDQKREKCIEFQYLGCGGNPNRFRSREDCAARCETPYLRDPNAGSHRVSVKCEYSSWSPWSSCNRTCGHGMRTRYRTRITPGLCRFSTVETVQHEPCHLSACPAQ